MYQSDTDISMYIYYIQGFLKLYQSLNGDLKSCRITCAAHIDKTNELRLHINIVAYVVNSDTI